MMSVEGGLWRRRFSRRGFLKLGGAGITGMALFGGAGRAGAATTGDVLRVEASRKGPRIPRTLYGVFFEEINFAGDGGLYGELIRNRSFDEDPDEPVHWSLVRDGGARGGMALDPDEPLNEAHQRSLRVDVRDLGRRGRLGVANEGYWGVPVRRGMTYTARIFARATAGFRGPLEVAVESPDGGVVYARGTTGRLGENWSMHTVRMGVRGAPRPTSGARLVVYAGGRERENPAGQSFWLGYVSLFPPTCRREENGNRVDLMHRLEALSPGFLRFPGGNYLEGQTIESRFDWEKSIGPPWERPGHQNTAWGYWSDDGLGLLEYLQLAEDLGATPILCVWAGYTLDHTVVPREELGPYVQSALDEIEYATGPTSSRWGARRAADGHPEPFDLRYVEVGNEDFFDTSGSYDEYRYPMFYDAIKARYPHIQVIATTPVKSRPMDVLDEHYYNSPRFFVDNARRYDEAPRDGTKIFVGEYAATEGSPTGTLEAAVGEAAFMTGLERNSDLVVMASYAPLFVRVGHNQWPTNLIGYDALSSYGSPSYHVQRMFSNNTGDVVLPVEGPEKPVISSPEAGRWYHLAGVYDGEAENLRLYVDGTLYDSVPYPGSGAWSGRGHTAIGRGKFSGNQVDFVDGRIDDVRLYARALGDEEVRKLSGSGLAGWWKFDEGSGTVARDSADGHDGTLENGAGWAAGRVGSCSLSLNGSGQYVDVPAPVVDTSRSFTVAAWVNLASTGGYQTFVSIDGDQVSAFYLQKRDDTGTFAFSRLPADDPQANSDVVYASAGRASDLQYVASRDERRGTIYLKVVNASGSPRTMRVVLDGVKRVRPEAVATVLTSASGSDQNTLSDPDKVAPVRRKIRVGRTFHHEFPPISVTVFRIEAR
ncbi:MAG: hypothetical protein K6T51_07705 [Rubrobacteraceae bacterium]|nr:hypothetical protein [Rubrobacteraceae bacterium]MCL6438481.1 hypothetical protein [Rubrobacteraceae bacterium]